MTSETFFIENDIKTIILKHFPSLIISIYYESNDDEYFISIPFEDIYYSDEYQKLIMQIKTEYLWKNNLNNFYFIWSNQFCCDEMNTIIYFKDKISNQYKNWSVFDEITRIDVNSLFNVDYYGLAA